MALLALLVLAIPAALCAEEAADRGKAEGLEARAIALDRESKPDEAIARMKEAIQADPAYDAALTELGYMLLKKDRDDEALKCFDRALKLAPGSHAAKTGKGIVLSHKGDLKGAEEMLKDALRLNPDPVRTYYELGVLYMKLNQPEKAVQEFREGIRKFEQGRG